MTKIFYKINKFCNRGLKPVPPPPEKKKKPQHPKCQIFYCSLMGLNVKDAKDCHNFFFDSVLTKTKQTKKLITAWKPHIA